MSQEWKRRDAQPASGFHARGAAHAADEGVEDSVAFFFGSGDGTQNQDLIQKLTNKEAGPYERTEVTLEHHREQINPLVFRTTHVQKKTPALATKCGARAGKATQDEGGDYLIWAVSTQEPEPSCT